MADSDRDSERSGPEHDEQRADPDNPSGVYDTVAGSALEDAPGEPDPEAEDPLDRSVIIGMGGRWLSEWALRLAILGIATWGLLRVGGTFWVGLLPVLLALIICTVLWPIVRVLASIGVPKALGALLSLLIVLGGISGLIISIAPSIVDQSVELANTATIGLRDFQDWISGPPLNINDEQIDEAINQVTSTLQDQGRAIADGVFAGLGAVGSGVVTLVITLVLCFFFLKDGSAFLPWLRRSAGRTAGRHLTEVLTRAWNTLGGFIRTQAIVSFVDAFFIYIGLVIVGVPLALALAIITFIGGFIPIVGAFTAGALSVIVALVALGFTEALIVLVIVVAVQQLEGNILQPVLQSKAMNLHPVIVLLSVAAGTTLFGIIGAFLAVPVVATGFVALRYLGEQIDLRTGEVTAGDVAPATEEGEATAWLGELSKSNIANRFRKATGKDTSGESGDIASRALDTSSDRNLFGLGRNRDD